MDPIGCILQVLTLLAAPFKALLLTLARHRSGRYAALHVLFSHAGKTCTRRGPTFGYGLAFELLRIELSHKTQFEVKGLNRARIV